MKSIRKTAWARYKVLWACLCCRPHSDDSVRPIDVLRVSHPSLANRIYNLQIYEGNVKNEWRLKIDCIAEYGILSMRYYKIGEFNHKLGNFFTFVMSLAAVLTPLLIGLQGSLGSESCDSQFSPNGTQLNTGFCITVETVDEYIKYTVISLSVINSVISTLNQVYRYRDRGVKTSKHAALMLREIEDFLALVGTYEMRPEDIHDANQMFKKSTEATTRQEDRESKGGHFHKFGAFCARFNKLAAAVREGNEPQALPAPTDADGAELVRRPTPELVEARAHVAYLEAIQRTRTSRKDALLSGPSTLVQKVKNVKEQFVLPMMSAREVIMAANSIRNKTPHFEDTRSIDAQLSEIIKYIQKEGIVEDEDEGESTQGSSGVLQQEQEQGSAKVRFDMQSPQVPQQVTGKV